MSAAYDPQQWQMFYTFIGAAAATLTGLLAVALSINPERIMGTPTHAARSREALAGFLVLIVASILILIPGQSQVELGIVLFLKGFFVLVGAVFLQRRTLNRLHALLRRAWIVRITLFDTAAVFGMVAGLSLATSSGGGLYYLVPTVMICLVWGLINCWQLLVWLPEKRK